MSRRIRALLTGLEALIDQRKRKLILVPKDAPLPRQLRSDYRVNNQKLKTLLDSARPVCCVGSVPIVSSMCGGN